MARKETYREKYINKQIAAGELSAEKPAKKERIPISGEKQFPYLEGKVLLIDKPLHWTSFDMIRKLRNMLQIKKIGHAGTLDPLATGLLIVCTGKFTKKINEYMAQQKEYTGHFTLGAVTPTYDLESSPEQHKNFSFVSNELLHNTTEKFNGDIMQFPPIYSAIKIDGEALYQLARRGQQVDLQARPISIAQFEITSIDLPVVGFRVVCSTGTYIRSLAHDFGQELGCGAYLSSLRRTKIGEFNVEDAISLEQIEHDVK